MLKANLLRPVHIARRLYTVSNTAIDTSYYGIMPSGKAAHVYRTRTSIPGIGFAGFGIPSGDLVKGLQRDIGGMT